MNIFYILIIILIVIVSGLLIVYARRRRSNISGRGENSVYTDFSDLGESSTVNNSIYIFGDFTVRDRSDNDITHLFTPRLKNIFIVLLQYSIMEDGISSNKLNEIFWADKDADKAKNIRGVTINSLRKILNEINGINLIYDKNVFRLVISDECYCDCIRLLYLVKNKEVDQHIDEYTGILRRGNFLKSFNLPLFDSFRTFIEQEIEPTLILSLGRSFKYSQFERSAILSKSLLWLNPLSEIGLQFLVHSLQNMNRNNLAKDEFDEFVTTYNKVTGREFVKSYSDI